MTIHVSIHQVKNKQIELEFYNDGLFEVFLCLKTTGLYEDGDYFQFEPKVARYIGSNDEVIVSQEPDLVRLKPSKRERVAIDLEKLYEFSSDDELKVKYSGYHPLAGPGSQGIQLESLWLTLL